MGYQNDGPIFLLSFEDLSTDRLGGGSDNIVEPGLTTTQVYDTAMNVPRIDRNKATSLFKSGASRNSIAKELCYSRATVSKIIKSVDPQT